MLIPPQACAQSEHRGSREAFVAGGGSSVSHIVWAVAHAIPCSFLIVRDAFCFGNTLLEEGDSTVEHLCFAMRLSLLCPICFSSSSSSTPG